MESHRPLHPWPTREVATMQSDRQRLEEFLVQAHPCPLCSGGGTITRVRRGVFVSCRCVRCRGDRRQFSAAAVSSLVVDALEHLTVLLRNDEWSPLDVSIEVEGLRRVLVDSLAHTDAIA